MFPQHGVALADAPLDFSHQLSLVAVGTSSGGIAWPKAT